jgi:hypothetical protein
VKGYTAYAGPDGGNETLSASEQPRAVNAGIENSQKVAQAEGAIQKPAKAADQTDDLLNPTQEELSGTGSSIKGAGKAAQPAGAARKADTTNAVAAPKADADAPADAPAAPVNAAAESRKRAAPVISIQSDVDPESWAEYGGWYRQDYAIFYRPKGHKDKFIYSWLVLTGPQAPKGDASPAAAVFDVLTSKDAQGSCTKCHSVDAFQDKGRVVNFSPPSVKNKQGRITNFIHEPHFGDLENRCCLTCHNLEKSPPKIKN